MAPRTQIREDDDKGNRRKVWVPITVRYERIFALFEGNNGDAVKKYKRELLGSDTQIVSPDVYNLLSLSREVFGEPKRLLEMIADPYQIKDAAKIIAQAQLAQMVEIVTRHDNLQAQKLERAKQKAASKQKKRRK